MISCIILISFIFEVVTLALIEKKMWGTIYTPLNVLMIPFAAIALFSIVFAGFCSLYPFCYDSILVWEVGLLVFFIPSALIRFLMPDNADFSCLCIKNDLNIRNFTMILLPIIILYGLYILKSAKEMQYAASIGSDDFADKTSSFGPWAHLFVIVIALEIFCFQFISRKRWWLIFGILLCVLYGVIAQIKGWVLIPIFAGVFVNIFSNRLRLNIKKISYVCLIGTGFFFLSYYLNLVVSKNEQMSNDILFFIFKNFTHYLTSGVLGLSMDMERGILEPYNPGYLYTPFVNIYNLIANEPMLGSLNLYYLETLWPGLHSNIRSFMGTIYIYGGPFWGSLTVLLFSSIAYSIRAFRIIRQNCLLLPLDAWFCAILFMGWFDYYFALLNPYEVLFFLWLLPYFFSKNVSIFNKKVNKNDIQ